MFHSIRDMILHRHFWRNVSFSELSELYVSLLLRTMALSLIGIFIPVYLYQLGYQITDIALYFVVMYGVRIYTDPIMSNFVRRFGPKHVLRMSYLGLIINLGLLLLMQYYSIPLLLVSLSQSLATGPFYIAFNLEFSKVKNVSREGKQLGSLFTFQKIGGVLGPLSGGVVASYFGIQYTILAAMVLLIMASIPLFMTPETVKFSKYKRFEYSDLVRFKRDFWPSIGYGLNATGTVLVWPLFISITIFKENVYASLGFVTTISLIMAVATAYFFGQVIDDKKGRALLNWSSFATGLSFFIRPFITSLSGVLAVNIAVEPVANGIAMPYSKGLYDASDNVGKRRLSYLTTQILYYHIARTGLWMLVWVIAAMVGGTTALEIAFVVSGLGTFLIMSQRFEALRR